MIGQRIGNYEITEEIGRGGMAVVYRANDLNLDRTVAVKVLPEQFTFDEEFVERFLREARTAANLSHPNIVTIHNVGQEGNIRYFAMNYIDGQSLSSVIREKGKLPIDEAVRIVSDICKALEYAHSEGVVHRDIKSDNILIDKRGNVIVTDFGIAKAAEGTRLTQTGTTMGTPEYMSPEQARGEGELDSRTDIYSLGIVLYEMLTGGVPFTATTPLGVAMKQAQDPPPPPRELDVSIPDWLEAIVLKCLAKDRGERYQTAAELLADLQANQAPAKTQETEAVQPQAGATRIVRQQETATPAKSVPAPATAIPTQRNVIPWIAGLGGLAVVLAIVAIIFATRDGNGSKAYQPPSRTSMEQTKTPAQRAAEQKRLQIKSYLSQAQTNFSAGDYGQAQTFVDKILELEPNHSQATQLQNQITQAIASQKAQRAKERQLKQHLANIKSYLESNLYQQVLSEVAKAEQLDPNNAEIQQYKRQANAAIDEADSKAKQVAKDRSIRKLIQEGNLHLANKEYNAAIAKFDEVLGLDSSHAEARGLKAKAEAALRAPQPPPKTITGKDGAEMMLIPAGEFQMGSNDGDDDEKPVHPVSVDAFYMDKYEVTNAKYAKFLNDYGKNADAAGHELIDLDSSYCLIEKSGSVYRPKSGYANHPVIEVTWYGAAAYAQYYGKRLPTEAEWEKAARGGLAGKKYPWGDNITHDNANYSGTGGRDQWDRTSPVGSFPPNGYGLYDMAGNVWEWCADGWDENYYSKSPKNNPKGPGTPVLFVNNDFTNVNNRRVCRGGSWVNNPLVVRCANRTGTDPSVRFNDVGFRLVLSSRSIPR